LTTLLGGVAPSVLTFWPDSRRQIFLAAPTISISLLRILLALFAAVLLVSMSSAATSSSSAAARVHALLSEHAVALSSLPDAHAAVQIALHLHTLQREGIKCCALNDQETQASKALPTIPPGWSASADGFCFQYVMPSAASSSGEAGGPSKRLLVKSIRMDRSLLVHATTKPISGSSSGASASSASGESPAAVRSLDLNVDDQINSNALRAAPAASSSGAAAAGGAGGASAGPDFENLYKDLPALLARYDSAVLDPLLPKPPSSDAAKKDAAPAHDSLRVQHGPLRVPPRGYVPDSEGGDGGDDDNPHLRDPFRRQPRGDFAGDLDPLAVGGGPNGGMLMGPRNFPGSMGGGGHPRGGHPSGPPGTAPRFDPYGPMPGMGDPDFDELPPPGVRGPNLPGPPLGGPLGGPRRRPDARGGPGGFGGPPPFGGGGGGGFGGPHGFGGGGGFM
jgi:hypothetical protein